jgi:hypothetical protein
VDGHPVICVSYKRQPPTPAEPTPGAPTPGPDITGYKLNGDPYYGDTADHWTGNMIEREMASGFVGTMLDCYTRATADEQTAFLDELDSIANFRETINPEPTTSPTSTSPTPEEENAGEEAAARADEAAEIPSPENTPTTPISTSAPTPPRDLTTVPVCSDTTGRTAASPAIKDTDRDPTTQALYDYLSQLSKDLMGWLLNPSCDTTQGSTPEDTQAALLLATFCQHTLLDDIMRKLQRCSANETLDIALKPITPAEPQPPTPAGAGGCACQSWPGWIICPNCTGDYKCTCPGTCIPIPASTRNC